MPLLCGRATFNFCWSPWNAPDSRNITVVVYYSECDGHTFTKRCPVSAMQSCYQKSASKPPSHHYTIQGGPNKNQTAHVTHIWPNFLTPWDDFGIIFFPPFWGDLFLGAPCKVRFSNCYVKPQSHRDKDQPPTSGNQEKRRSLTNTGDQNLRIPKTF